MSEASRLPRRIHKDKARLHAIMLWSESVPCERRHDRQVIRGAMAKNVELLSYGNLSWITAVQVHVTLISRPQPPQSRGFQTVMFAGLPGYALYPD